MSFLYEKGRAATFLLLCAYRFKKGNASLDFEQDDFVNKKQRQLPFPISSPGRKEVLRVTSLRCPKVLIIVLLLVDKTPFSTSIRPLILVSPLFV